MATDAMFKLEHGSDDQKKGKAAVMTLSNLEGRRDEWKDDYVLNKLARQKFRVIALNPYLADVCLFVLRFYGPVNPMG